MLVICAMAKNFKNRSVGAPLVLYVGIRYTHFMSAQSTTAL